MKIITNAEYPGFFSRIGEAGCRLTSFRISRLNCHPKFFLRNSKWRDATLFSRHQPFVGTPKAQLDSKGGRDQNVDFSGLDFLQIAGGNFSTFGQFVLRQFFAHTFPAHVRAQDLDSLPFFLGNGHDILHRFCSGKMNDTYIVKRFRIFLANTCVERCNRRVLASNSELTCKVIGHLENKCAPTRALATRLLEMKVSQKGIPPLPATPLQRRQESCCFHLERPGQNHQFGIRDATKLRFNFRERAATQIPTEDRTARGEHCLRHFLLITQLSDLRADNVLRFSHAPKMELDTTLTEELNCSVFGAICSTAMAQRKKPDSATGQWKKFIGKGAGKMKHFENPPTDIYPIVTGASFARLKNKQH
jgi:hypothetical protein